MIKEGIIKAYAFAEKKHESQTRKFSNLPYFSHPKAVARIIEQLTGDEEMIIVALLHDTLEDTDTQIEEIEGLFGTNIKNYVVELTTFNSTNISKKNYLGEKIQKLSDKALTVKLADRLHNIKYLEEDDVGKTFMEKYFIETEFIMNKLENRADKEFTEAQTVLINLIKAKLDFLRVRYDFD